MSSALKKASSFLLAIIGHEFLASRLAVVVNPGVSFGVEFPLVFIILLNLVILFLFLGRKDWGLFLISMGGLINLLDRIRFDYVRDYWQFLGTGLYNNLNDWLIAIGLLIFSVELIWTKLK